MEVREECSLPHLCTLWNWTGVCNSRRQTTVCPRAVEYSLAGVEESWPSLWQIRPSRYASFSAGSQTFSVHPVLPHSWIETVESPDLYFSERPETHSGQSEAGRSWCRGESESESEMGQRRCLPDNQLGGRDCRGAGSR